MNSPRIFSFLLALIGNVAAVRPLFIAFAVLLTVVLPVVAQTPDSFNPDVDGDVDCLAVQADGKILLGGSFNVVAGGTSNGLARLNADGNLDVAFKPDTNNDVSALAVQTDGKILIGGYFTTVGGQTRNHLARLNADGSLDASFNPNVYEVVYTLALQADGKILVGGNFILVGGQLRNRIARLNVDGSLDTAFNPGVDGVVVSLALQEDGKILVGGYFSTVGGQPRNCIARLNADGSLDTSFNPNANSSVSSLMVQRDGKVLVGGSFSTVGGQPRNHIARLNVDGSLDTAFNPDANNAVNSLALQEDGKILASGRFTYVGGQPRNRIARLNTDGSLDHAFNPDVNSSTVYNSTVYSLAVQADGKVLAGGDFTTVSGQSRRRIARLINDPAISSLAITGTSQIDWTRGGSAPEVSQVTFERWTGSAWSVLGNATRVAGDWRMTGLSLPLNGWVRASGRTSGGSFGFVEQIATYGGGTFPDIAVSEEVLGDVSAEAAVNFGTVDWTMTNAVARTLTITNDGSAPLSGLAVSLTGADSASFTLGSLTVTSLAPGASTSFTVGFLPRAAGLLHCTLAIVSNDGDESSFQLALQGSGNYCDLGFNSNANSGVLSLATQADGKCLVGGYFTTLGGQPRNGIARLNADGDLDAAFNPNAGSGVVCLAVQADGKILVGGGFTSLGGQPRNCIARLNADGSLDAAFNPNANGRVDSLTVQANGKILIGGWFTAVGGQARTFLARLNADGSLDTAFNPDADSGVVCLAVQADGKILVGGGFTSLGGQPRNRIARLNADGSLDAAFNPNANEGVVALGVQADGKILVVGGFTTLNGQARSRIARLNADGSLDTAFNPNANNNVDSLAVQVDGKILVGGGFTTLGGQPRNRIARLNADGSLDAAFNPSANSNVTSLALQADGEVLVGGDFTSVGGQPRSHIARLINDTVATSTLVVTGTSQIDWTRGGSAPEVSQVTFEHWTGSAWAVLSNATRISGGWRMTGLSLPVNGWVRASGRTSGGNQNGSSGFVEQISTYGGEAFPDIAVSVEGLGNVSAGAAMIDFGTGDWTTPSTRTLTVTNNGNATLSGLSVALSGADPARFTLSSLPVTSLAPGASTNFTVGFLPRVTGLSRCTLSIASNDGDESPFLLTLQGTGNYCDLGFDPNVNSDVYSLAVQADGKILVGGWFTAVGGQTRNRIARLNADGTLDSAFNPNDVDGGVTSLVVQTDGKILVGGWFATLGGQSRIHIARLNADGSLDADFNIDNNGGVDCLAVQADGKILVGGDFSVLGGQPRNHIARLNADGSLDSTFNPNANSSVKTLAVQADGKILVGGWFTTLGGQMRNRIARLNANGSLDTAFNPNAEGIVNCLAVQADGKIVVGGWFTLIGGQMRNRIARLNASGSLDTTFNPNADNGVNSLAVQADGKVLVGGWFTTVGGQPRNHIARLDADGGLDVAFNPNADSSVESLAVQADGKILVGGRFYLLGGQIRSRIARLTNDPAMSSLVVTNTSQINWSRGGSAPEVSQVTFEQWTGSAWVALGNATRIVGGWRMTGLSLPVSGQIRARGRTSGGLSNAGSGLVEQISTYAFPDIALEAPTGTPRIYGSAALAFSATPPSQSTDCLVTIRNTGPGTLDNILCSLKGTDAGEFSLVTTPPVSLAPGSSAEFAIRFAPTSVGAKSATFFIASNDPDENPFRVALSGIANTPPIFAGHTVTTTYETELSISLAEVLAKASDADGDVLTIRSVGNSAQGGTTALQATMILYTPPAKFSGTDTIPVTIVDGRGGRVTGSVTVNVQANLLDSPKWVVEPGGVMQLIFQGIPGEIYVVERSTNLSDWTRLQTSVADKAGRLKFADPSPPSPNGFYRVVKPVTP